RRRARRAAIVAARRVGLTTRNLTLPLRALVVAWRRQPAEQWATLVALRVLRPVSEAQPRARVPAVDRKLSPEHVYPRWLKATSQSLSGLRQTTPGRVVTRTKHNEHTRSGPVFDSVTRDVCEACDNGWNAP